MKKTPKDLLNELKDAATPIGARRPDRLKIHLEAMKKLRENGGTQLPADAKRTGALKP